MSAEVELGATERRAVVLSPAGARARWGLIAIGWSAVVLQSVSPLVQQDLGDWALGALFLVIAMVVYANDWGVLRPAVGSSSAVGPGRSRRAVVLASIVSMPSACAVHGPLERMACWRAESRAEEVIRALDTLVASGGEPPARLRELVPRYLDEIPTTGAPACPELGYELGYSPERDGWQSWRLVFSCRLMTDWVYEVPRDCYERPPAHESRDCARRWTKREASD